MSVPHIADDDGRLGHVPALSDFGDRIAPLAGPEIQRSRHFGAIQNRFLILRRGGRGGRQYTEERPSVHMKLLVSPKTSMCSFGVVACPRTGDIRSQWTKSSPAGLWY